MESRKFFYEGGIAGLHVTAMSMQGQFVESLAQDADKGHNRGIFDKLDVERFTKAIARARKPGLR
ncbi:MAG TPA: hypothetical protein VMV68_08370 [Spirochaetia bacterium]|nr:hypothetical protein [Spirochaetia bacterium]